jgi:hypothetical protein
MSLASKSLVSASLILLGVCTSQTVSASDEGTFKSLYRHCLKAKRCVAGDREFCDSEALRCQDYVDGIGVAMGTACLALRSGFPTPEHVTAAPGNSSDYIDAIIRYGDKSKVSLGEDRNAMALIALSSEMPCNPRSGGTKR